jgi:hypothetical protein
MFLHWHDALVVLDEGLHCLPLHHILRVALSCPQLLDLYKTTPSGCPLLYRGDNNPTSTSFEGYLRDAPSSWTYTWTWQLHMVAPSFRGEITILLYTGLASGGFHNIRGEITTLCHHLLRATMGMPLAIGLI